MSGYLLHVTIFLDFLLFSTRPSYSAVLGRSFGINKFLVMRMAHKTGTQVTVLGLLNLK